MGKGSYKTIIVPPCKYMPETSIKILNDFVAGGGKVFVIKGVSTPEISGATYIESVKDIIDSALKLSGDTGKIRLGIRETENGKLYMLFNESNEVKTFRIGADEKLTRLYAETGEIVMPENYEVTLQVGEMAFFFSGEIKANKQCVYKNVVELDSEFTFKRTNQFIIGDMNFISKDINEDEQIVELGDWTNLVGIEFSGSGIYKTTFNKPKESGAIMLDLGEVHYSCEVFVNGISKGIVAMSPYTVELQAETLKEENILEIRVSNTAANEYESTTSFDKWKPWQLTSYYPTQKLYHVDALSGGLYGPVKLYYWFNHFFVITYNKGIDEDVYW